MHCASCGFDNPAGMKFCGACGSSLANVCPACSTENPAGFKFCGACGTPLTAEKAAAPPAAPTPAEPPAPAQPPAPDPEVAQEDAGERRQITVAFVDLVGSTRLSETLDPEDLRNLVREYQAEAARAVERYQGHIAQYLGDGILVYFGYPTAHEDDPIRAVHAGLAILDGVAELSSRAQRTHGVELEARVGIHTGLVVAGEVGGGERREQLAMGKTPNVAARLEGLAKAGEVVVSAATRRLISTHFEFDSIGEHQPKGIGEPMEVFRVLGTTEVDDPFELLPDDQVTPLVGRNREVDQLQELWDKATEGRGQVVLLSGDPGVGKSRLTRAFRQQVGERPHTYLWARGLAFNESTSFSPMVEMLSRLCGIQKEDGPEARFAKLDEKLAEHGLAATEEAVLLASLLELPVPEEYPRVELPPLRRKQRTMEALIRFVESLAKGEPLLLVVEDLHWIDPSTKEFLEQLVAQGPSNPMLSFFTTRPQADPQWASRSFVTRLNLTNLGDEEVEAMVLRVSGGKPLPRLVLDQILEKTDGVPLFVEELTKMILESGVLTEKDDQYELTGDLAALTIPSSLQDSLNARLDSLEYGKNVAQVAAAIDREFDYGLLQAIWNGSEEDLRAGLQELVAADFLYQRGILPYATFIFKNALIQDAATASMLRGRRQRIHHRLAKTLTAIHRFRTEGEAPEGPQAAALTELAERVETTPERIALHFAAAGEAASAVDWWLVAARRGLERSANQEVIVHMSAALDALATQDLSPDNLDRELSVQTLLGAALTGARGYAAPEVEAAFARALALALETEEAAKIFQAQLGLWMFHVVRADFPAAFDSASALMALADDEDDRSFRVEAGFALGCTEFFRGWPEKALEHLESAVALDGPDRDRSISQASGQDAGVTSLIYIGMCHWMAGDPALALEKAAEAIDLAERIEHPYSLVYALHFASWIRLWMRQYAEADELAARVVSMSIELGYFWVTLASIVRGSVLVHRGSTEDGLAQMAGGLAPYRGAGARLSQTLQLALIAEGHIAAGSRDDAKGVLAEAAAAIEETDERFWEADLKRLEALCYPDDPAKAERLLREALDIAVEQGAAGHALRAALSLAESLVALGRDGEVAEFLGPARDAFSDAEGLPDVVRANEILGR